MNNDDAVVVIDQHACNRKGASSAFMMALLLVAMLGVASTFAFLTYTGNATPNRFTVDEFLSADLLEPQWTNAALSDNGVSEDATSETEIDSTKVLYYGVDGIAVPKASTLQTPGSYVAKNPFVMNTSVRPGGYGFAGIKVQFKKVNAEGKYVNMTGDEVKALLSCYYIGNLATSTDNTTTATTAETKPGFADGTNSQLGTGWHQLLGSTEDGTVNYGATTAGTASATGAMYFINASRLKAYSWDHDEVKEDAESDTWGYATDNTYATTPLFQTIRYSDEATQTAINALRKALDPEDAVTKAGYVPGWKMVVSCGLVQSNDEKDVSTILNSDGSVSNSTIFFKSLKNVMDANKDVNLKDGVSMATKPTTASGIREGSKLGSYITHNSDGTASLTEGKGVAEPTNE